MTTYRRRLPHISVIGQPAFLTWRLYGSLPPNRVFSDAKTSGEAFAAMDRLLDQARTGPVYLRQPPIAAMIADAFHYNAEVLHHYELHAYVVMPNHIHLLLTPIVPLANITKSLKTITAKRANTLLSLTGQTFWQDESYDHLVRNDIEYRRIERYIEQNPLRAGLVSEPGEYAWSSGSATGGSRADRGVCPTLSYKTGF